MTSNEHLDVVVVGAGLSGIGAAATLRSKHPELSLAILERRTDLGGTWDLFRYPGVRSDSDMYTLGYRFRPWTDTRSLADGGFRMAELDVDADSPTGAGRIYARAGFRQRWQTETRGKRIPAAVAGQGERAGALGSSS